MRTNCFLMSGKFRNFLKPLEPEILPLVEILQCVFIRESIRLILFKVIVAVYLRNHRST